MIVSGAEFAILCFEFCRSGAKGPFVYPYPLPIVVPHHPSDVIALGVVLPAILGRAKAGVGHGELEETARLVHMNMIASEPLTDPQLEELRQTFGARW